MGHKYLYYFSRLFEFQSKNARVMEYLAAMGITPTLVKDLGLYQGLLQVIEQNKLGPEHVTVGLVMALCVWVVFSEYF